MRRSVLCLGFVVAFAVMALPQTFKRTWFVRPDGGSRLSKNAPNGECDGLSDKPYLGKQSHHHCALKDFRYLYDDQHSYGTLQWAIASGDTVIVRGGPWRIGFEQGKTPNDAWCSGIGPIGCGTPPVPSGTPAEHTRILGENYASCSKKTQLHGGHAVGHVINLRGSAYVDVQCLDLTDWAQCSQVGSPALPKACSHDYPSIDDYASNGIVTSQGTHDILLQDLQIHGFTARGILGPIGGTVTANRVQIGYNGGGGWDFDDGSSTPNINNPSVIATRLTIEFNGCNEEYPITHALPAISCYDQNSGGYGDGLGTGTNTPLSFSCENCLVRYNTQDGIDLGHVDFGNSVLKWTASEFYGNMGAPIKWGPNETSATLENNLIMINCARMSAPISGVPNSYNRHLSYWCRAGDGLSFNFRQGGTVLIANNSIVSYVPNLYDVNCWDKDCSKAVLTVRNNIHLGYANNRYPSSFNYNGNSLPAGNLGGNFRIVRDHNIWYGLRSTGCTFRLSETCSDPLFEDEPPTDQPLSNESDLDNFNFRIVPNSPAKKKGISIPGLTADFTGAPRGNPPSIGAFE